MQNVHEMKRSETPETPILLLDCVLSNGETLRWATHRVTVGSDTYLPRILRHNNIEMRAASEDGIDAAGRFTVTLDNVDGYASQLESSTGFKGSKLTARFVFISVETGMPVTDPVTVFLGQGNPPEEITSAQARLSFVSRLGLQRTSLPTLRIQPRCPWMFPANEQQRQEAVNGGSEGEYSRFHGCGYSPDKEGGAGNASAQGPFTACSYTKADCVERGMFKEDGLARPTARFAGFQFLPPSATVRANGSKEWTTVEALDNRARSNDVVPLIYGTNWMQPPVVFTRSDGNLTHCEVLIGSGPIAAVHKVVASGVEIPAGEPGRDMGATGWYNVVSLGTRNGAFNLNFVDGSGQPIGDPHGGLAILAVAIPNRLNNGQSVPRIEVLADGMKLPRYDQSGALLGTDFTRNPSWILLDVLRRSGWKLDELNMASFAAAAANCDEVIEVKDSFGNPRLAPKFECNLAVNRRMSAAEIVRGIRTSAALMITFGADGKLELKTEDTLSRQQPAASAVSNSTMPLGGGWPSYEFGDGTNGSEGILRRADGAAAFRIWSRSTAESPNRWSVEFQNGFNEYQQDSVSLADLDDVVTTGQELSATVPALGLPHFDQAARITRFHLMKSIQGNRFVEFETGPHALGLRPGFIIAVSYGREGLNRTPFRITRIIPGENYQSAMIVAQIHNDVWYELLNGGTAERQQRGRTNGRWGVAPRPITGTSFDVDGSPLFGIEESLADEAGSSVRVKVRFRRPAETSPSSVSVPIVGLTPQLTSSGGTLTGGRSYYYAVSALDGSGSESELSFIVRAAVPAGATWQVTLRDLSFAQGTTAFRVYRGPNPQQLYLIVEQAGTASSFTDPGAVAQSVPPPDPNYDHANFYWREELLPVTEVSAASPHSITGHGLSLVMNAFRSAAIRIVSGKGEGQERFVTQHDAAQFEINRAWTTVPDATSSFVVSEASWRFGSSTRSEEVQFEMPNRPGVFMQISGRAATVSDVETDAEVSPLVRYRIGGLSAGSDTDVPQEPSFALTSEVSGELWLTGIGFPTLQNTTTISSGTLVVHYVDETAPIVPLALAGAIDAAEQWISLSTPSGISIGDVVMAGRELMRVIEVTTGGQILRVVRGTLGTVATVHAANASVRQQSRLVVVAPIQRDFFGSPASGNYALPITLKNAKVSAAEFYMTNRVGDSPTAVNSYALLSDGGLRTYSGGQYAMQVEGALAAESSVAPLLVVESNRSVAEIRATVAEPPVGGDIVLRMRANGQQYCDLTIPDGSRISGVVGGAELPRLASGTELSLDVVSVPTGSSTLPGRNLTVTIRL